MNATEIKRVPFAAFDDDLMQSRAKLALEAKEKLGYSKMAQSVITPSSLLAALRKLDIEPLSNIDVENYKHSKEKVFVRRSSWILLAHWLTVVPLLSVYGPSCAIYSLFNDFGHYNIAPLWSVMSAVFGCIFAAGIIAWSCSITFGDERYKTPRKLRLWWTYNLQGYPAAIPEFVLDKAVRIKEECPEAKFYIEHLVTTIDVKDAEEIKERKDRVMRQQDPFLVVQTADERYYIEVWDEKEYEARM